MTLQTLLQDVADDLLESYGESLTFTRVTEGAYNTATSTTAAGTTINYTVFAHIDKFDNREVDGEIIRATDLKIIAQVPTSYTPLVGDKVTISTKSYYIINVLNYRVQGSDCAYEIQARV